MNIKKLKHDYETACNAYLKAFCEKQEMDFMFWVADEIGSIALCSDFYFNMSDIKFDIDTEQPKGFIIEWYDECLENPDKAINYYSYIHGLRIKDIKD